jgi:hypothetical protein
VLTTQHPPSAKVGTNFADNRRSLGGIVRSRTKATEFVLFLCTIASPVLTFSQLTWFGYYADTILIRRLTKRHINSSLRRCSNVTRDKELLAESPEEGCDDEEDVVVPRT